jgi:hypothetical protein
MKVILVPVLRHGTIFGSGAVAPRILSSVLDGGGHFDT